MASRRVRIKGIANIPVRRKTETTQETAKAVENNLEIPQQIEKSINSPPKVDEHGNRETGHEATINTPSTQEVTNNTTLTQSETCIAQTLPNCDTNEICKASVNKTNANVNVTGPVIPNQMNLNEITNKSTTAYKFNRIRIKPVPKLIRRNSVQGSASESEDDGRKTKNRNRNDSVCSSSSMSLDTTTFKENTFVKGSQYNTIIQRKCKRTDQSRKLAEARRDFIIKFGKDIPDKKKLTMMDLIFYNPTTNPMSKKDVSDTSRPVEQQTEETVIIENDVNETQVDEDIPVPQVKVGPNGEIIIDEQSLVIEQTGAKKGREQLANSQVIVDDSSKGYGHYKRPQRFKDWTTAETLNFYRALQTVGTDFTLMQSLFPRRQRRELKLKFKKEEKLNTQLIDKALLNPSEFDLTALKNRLEEQDQLESKRKVKKPRAKKPRKSKSLVSKKRIIENINEESSSSDSFSINLDGCGIDMNQKSRKSNRNGINYTEDIEDSDNGGDGKVLVANRTNIKNVETINEKIAQGNSEKNLELLSVSLNSEENQIDPFQKDIQKLLNIDPGSLMILSSTDQAGEPVYKVFMVTPNSNLPVPMDTNLMHKITTAKTPSNIGNVGKNSIMSWQ